MRLPTLLTCLLLIAPCFGAESSNPDLKSFDIGHRLVIDLPLADEQPL
jgi:hypothetical protein